MGYPLFGMIELLKLLGGLLVGVFRSRAARDWRAAPDDDEHYVHAIAL